MKDIRVPQADVSPKTSKVISRSVSSGAQICKRKIKKFKVKAMQELLSGIPHDIYEQLPDEDKSSPFNVWNALKKQFEGTDKILANRKKAAFTDMDNFKMLPHETLFDAYSRYNIIVNRVKKLKGERSQEDFNMKFMNNLSLK